MQDKRGLSGEDEKPAERKRRRKRPPVGERREGASLGQGIGHLEVGNLNTPPPPIKSPDSSYCVISFAVEVHNTLLCPIFRLDKVVYPIILEYQ